MKSQPDMLVRIARQMVKASARGDLDAALKWTVIFERQLAIILRLVDIDAGDRRLRRFRHAIVAALEALAATNSVPKI